MITLTTKVKVTLRTKVKKLNLNCKMPFCDEVTASEDQEDSEAVEGEEEVTYNYNALKNAVSRNMSLWKSHDGPKDRQVFVHPVKSKFSQINYSDEDSEASDTESASGRNSYKTIMMLIIRTRQYNINSLV